MILSDGEIWESLENGEIEITPLSAESDTVQPSSVDLRLDSKLRKQQQEEVRGVAVYPPDLDVVDYINRYTDAVDIPEGGSYRMQPGDFLIGSTVEKVRLPLNMAARVEGKSSLARLGVSVHFTAPKIDPGYNNVITLELYNFGPFTVELKKEMKICALIIERLGRHAKQGYTGQFQSQS